MTLRDKARQRLVGKLRSDVQHVGAHVGHGFPAGQARIVDRLYVRGIVALGRNAHRHRRHLGDRDSVLGDPFAHALRLDHHVIGHRQHEAKEHGGAEQRIGETNRARRKAHRNEIAERDALARLQHRIAHPEHERLAGEPRRECEAEAPERLVAHLNEVVLASQDPPGEPEAHPVLRQAELQPAEASGRVTPRNEKTLGAAIVDELVAVGDRPQAPVDLQSARNEVIGEQLDEIDPEGRVVVGRDEQHAATAEARRFRWSRLGRLGPLGEHRVRPHPIPRYPRARSPGGRAWS